MQNKKQTATEWLYNKLSTCTLDELVGNINNWFQQAKQMEKEQIVEAFKHGELPPLFVNYNAEQYYNETYGK